jgi:transposase
MVSGGFKNFTSAKQFSAFIGICPCLNESGTSIRGYRGISRIGDKNIRAKAEEHQHSNRYYYQPFGLGHTTLEAPTKLPFRYGIG